jgi:hypothetical protein
MFNDLIKEKKKEKKVHSNTGCFKQIWKNHPVKRVVKKEQKNV